MSEFLVQNVGISRFQLLENPRPCDRPFGEVKHVRFAEQKWINGGGKSVLPLNDASNDWRSQVNETGDGISHTYTYDAEGNVTAVDSGSTATYVYDALNHRVRVQNSAGTYEYLFDPFGHKTSMWLTSSNFGVEGRIYMGAKQIAFRAQDGTTYFVHKNWLGTERYRTNYVGQTVANFLCPSARMFQSKNCHSEGKMHKLSAHFLHSQNCAF